MCVFVSRDRVLCLGPLRVILVLVVVAVQGYPGFLYIGLHLGSAFTVRHVALDYFFVDSVFKIRVFKF